MYWECRCPSDGGCDCAGHSVGLRGVGEFDFSELMIHPGSATGQYTGDTGGGFMEMAMFVVNAFSRAWSTIEGWVGIGDGRREADVIVPVQNALGERLAEIVADQNQAGVTRLQDYYRELGNMSLAFQKFISDPQFTDGRASQQAFDDIIPLIANIQTGIAQRIQQRGGSIPLTPTVTQGAGYILPRLMPPAQTTFPAIPQAGTIWPNAPLPTVRPQPITQVAGFDPVSMLMIAGVAFAFLRKGRR